MTFVLRFVRSRRGLVGRRERAEPVPRGRTPSLGLLYLDELGLSASPNGLRQPETARCR